MQVEDKAKAKAEALRVLAAMLNDPKITGKSLPMCKRCKRILRDPRSIAKGVGPECERQGYVGIMETSEDTKRKD